MVGKFTMPYPMKLTIVFSGCSSLKASNFLTNVFQLFTSPAGSLTCFVAVIAIFVLPDFPSNSETWLSPLEKKLAEKRMTEDAGVSDEIEKTGTMAVLASAMADWKVWYMAVTLSCSFLQAFTHLQY